MNVLRKIKKHQLFDLKRYFDITLLVYLFTHTALAWNADFTSLRHFSLLLYLMASIFYMAKQGRNVFRINIYIIWHLSFVFICLLSIIWAEYTASAKAMLFPMLMTVIILYPIYIRVKNRDDIDKLVRILILSCVLCGLYIMAVSPIESLGHDRLGNQANINPNLLAIPCSFAAILNLFYIQHVKNMKESVKLYFLTELVLASVVILTGSKTGFLILVAGVSIYFFFITYNYEKPIFIVIACIGLGVLIILIIRNSILKKLFLNAFVSLLNVILGRKGYVDISSPERLQMIIDALKLLKKSPFLGFGINNFSQVTKWNVYAHNNYAEIGSDLGMIGLFLYNWYPVLMLIKFVFLKKSRRIYRCLGITLCFLFFLLQIGNVCYSSIIVYIFVLIAAKISYLENMNSTV